MNSLSHKKKKAKKIKEMKERKDQPFIYIYMHDGLYVLYS